MKKRVVITGIGLLIPGNNSKDDLLCTLRNGISPIIFIPRHKELGMACQIGGMVTTEGSPYLTKLNTLGFNEANEFVKLSCVAAMQAWEDAGLKIPGFQEGDTDYDTGIIMGSGVGAIDIIAGRLIPFTDNGQTKRMRSTIVEYSMFSASTANVAGILALGNLCFSISSACSSSTDAIVMGCDRIRSGKALRMLAGGVEVYTPYSWSGFDAMRVLTRDYNDAPQQGSRPMSRAASGFVPSSGAAVVLLEEMESAVRRGATIYAEVKGCHSNSGGQRMGGTMTIPNPEGVVHSIRKALDDAETHAADVDLISGHLTSTIGDVHEVKNWKTALGCEKNNFPFINAPKSIFGHMIGAAGAIETIAAVLQLKHQFVHPSLNCSEAKEEIQAAIDVSKIPQQSINYQLQCVAKASFGFGDVNSCLILKKFE